MNYYDINSKKLVSLELLGIACTDTAVLRASGVLPIVHPEADVDTLTKDIVFGEMVNNGVVCWQGFSERDKSISGLLTSLEIVKQEKKEEFDKFFLQLDQLRARPSSSVAESLALGESASAEDVNILGTLNMIAEENREILANAQAKAIPTSATYDEAVAIINEIQEVKTWYPARFYGVLDVGR